MTNPKHKIRAKLNDFIVRIGGHAKGNDAWGSKGNDKSTTAN